MYIIVKVLGKRIPYVMVKGALRLRAHYDKEYVVIEGRRYTCTCTCVRNSTDARRTHPVRHDSGLYDYELKKKRNYTHACHTCEFSRVTRMNDVYIRT